MLATTAVMPAAPAFLLIIRGMAPIFEAMTAIITLMTGAAHMLMLATPVLLLLMPSLICALTAIKAWRDKSRATFSFVLTTPRLLVVRPLALPQGAGTAIIVTATVIVMTAPLLLPFGPMALPLRVDTDTTVEIYRILHRIRRGRGGTPDSSV